jgi:outer membrane protein assembly factor BamB
LRQSLFFFAFNLALNFKFNMSMKKLQFFNLGCVALIIFFSTKSFATEFESIYLWKFNCGALHSKPVIHDSIAYFGSTDKNLYAVNIKNGAELWHYSADSCNSFPAVKDSIVVFEAKNKLYALHALTGKFLWGFSTNPEAILSVGFTDYHHSSPVIKDTIVIFCDQSGYINGINLRSGKLEYQYLTDGHSAIRGTPIVKDSIVYAGDWIGNIYAINLKDSVQIWKHVMQNARNYYGAVVSEMIIRDSVLFFGSQHDVFSPLDIETGEPVWTYVDPRATYLPPTPVFYEDKIIIGTTIQANQIMCFENNDEPTIAWSFQALDIFFTTPIIKDSVLIMNSCNFDHKTGHIYFLNCKNGKPVREMQFTNTGPYIPALSDSVLFIGTNNGLYAANYNAIIEGKGGNITFKTDELELTYPKNSGKKYVNLNIKNEGDVCDSAFVSFLVTEYLEKTGFKYLPSKGIIGKLSSPGSLLIYTDSLPGGEYHIIVRLTSLSKPGQEMTKNIKVTIENIVSAESTIEKLPVAVIYPNPANEFIIFNLSQDIPCDINLQVFSTSGNLVMDKSDFEESEPYIYQWDLTDRTGSKCSKGEYICVIRTNMESITKKIMLN